MKKKFFVLLLLMFLYSVSFAGRKDCPKIEIVNTTGKQILYLSEHNGNLERFMKMDITVNNEEYHYGYADSLWSINSGLFIVHSSDKLCELPYTYANNFDAFKYCTDYLLIFSENGSLLRRIDSIVEILKIESPMCAALTITETTPITSVPLNYPAIPEDYSTDSYYIKNNTDELVYVVAPDYIGVPHPEAGILEEGESFFIPSQQVTNGLNFYRELYPGESFYLGKAAHPDGQEYSQTASEGFNEYLSLIYLLTPEMNLLYRLENFENYEFTESEDTGGKKVVLEIQEEMSVRHSEYFMADF